jgi:hypothetical protein
MRRTNMAVEPSKIRRGRRKKGEEDEEDPYPKTEESTPHLYKPVSFYPFVWPMT